MVTGGATGLGKAMATMLSKLGANVCIASRSEEKLKGTTEEIGNLTGNTVHYYSMDIRDQERVSDVIPANN